MKKTVLGSILALAVSVALLAGATFAWFTDSIVNSGNTITAGELRIEATAYDYDENGAGDYEIAGVNGGNALNFETTGQDLRTNGAAIIQETNWEPGASNAKLLKVENAGTLAAKVKLEFTTSGDLTDALWFDFIQVEEGKITGTFTKRPMNTLAALAEDIELTIKAYANVQFILVYGMYEDAGNDYQGASFAVDVAIKATQAAVEEDGFGNSDYDANARYLETQAMYISGGKVVTVNLDEADFSASGYDGVFSVGGGSVVTLEGNGTVVANDDRNYAMAVWAYGEDSVVVINGGYYTNNIAEGREDDQMDMIYASEGGVIIINGGTFKCVTPKWTLNVHDASYQDGSSTIIVRGGSFFEYNPSNAINENPAANFVAPGYKVIAEEKEDGTWYTVVPA